MSFPTPSYRLALVEVKDPKGKLTEDQVKFHAEWPVFVVREEAQARDVIVWLKS